MLTREQLAEKHSAFLNEIAAEFTSRLEYEYGLDSTDALKVSYLMIEKIEKIIERNDR